MEEKSKAEPESFTLEERWVIAAARDLAAVQQAIAVHAPDMDRDGQWALWNLRKKAGRILEQSVAALLVSEREAP